MIGGQVGKLTILRKLGEGGMGAVYLAEHQVMRTKHAVKVLLPHWTRNPMIVTRFVNESIAAGKIRHRNIIAVHDCAQLPDGSWYMVMDHLEGGTLRGYCSSVGGPLSVHETVQIMAPVANGVWAAHAAGIIHRDLKPDNIFLIQRDGNPRHPVVLDFGIAKLGDDANGHLTKTGMMAGTPAYMAPEQMRGLSRVDERADVYALGVITYQMITGGWLPYQAIGVGIPGEYEETTAPAIYQMQMNTSPIDPRARYAGIPERFAGAVLAAIDRDPARRPQTARAFAILLAEATPGDGFSPSGVEIVREYAHELLEIGNLTETVRGPKPAVMSTPSLSRYRLGDRLGMGGMAEVFRATMVGAEGFSRSVAVKRVLSGFSSVSQFASMFIDEARIASQLIHPNIVSVLDFDRDAEGRMFIAMELVEGCDLSKLAATGLLPYPMVVHVIGEVLRGLAFAHDLPIGGEIRGVVHRDISPQNVLLSWEGAVKVSDFGIAKARDTSAVTGSTLIKGKPQYMSPEQANGEPLDGRSDLFAVGVMLWELLAGRQLFEGDTRAAIAQVMFGQIPRPSALRADVPADLDAVTMRLLERELAQRYPNADAAYDDLARCADTPRNGSRELAKLLAARFPEAVVARSSSPRLDARTPVPASVPQDPARTVRERASDLRRPVVEIKPGEIPWSGAGTTLGGAASQSVARSRSRSRRRTVLALGALASVLVVAAVVISIRGRADEPAPASPPIEPAVGPVERPVSPPIEPAVTSLATLTIDAEPAGSRVVVNGEVRGKAPVSVSLKRGDRASIEISQEGYEPIRKEMTVERDDRMTLTLRAVAPAPPLDAQVVADPRLEVPPSPPTKRPRDRSSRKQTPKEAGSERPRKGTAQESPPLKSRREPKEITPDDVGGD